jgi:Tol biopolymer transport system component
VWQAWTQVRGTATSVIRSYSLVTGRRRLILSTAESAGYYYSDPIVNGDRLVLVKQPQRTQGAQILAGNLAGRHLRALTPPGEWNQEPFISQDILAWVHGSLTLGHTHGIVVVNLATGRKVALKRSSSQLPQVVAGRYVVFGPDYPTPYPRGSVQLYDALTGKRRTILAGPDARGFVPNPLLAAGGSAAVVEMDKPCGSANGVCPRHFVLIALGPE